jgi:hypothetical protein
MLDHRWSASADLAAKIDEVNQDISYLVRFDSQKWPETNTGVGLMA